jgi:hypothetical protein
VENWSVEKQFMFTDTEVIDRRRNTAIIEGLITYGANINVQDESGKTALSNLRASEE